jgi:rhamnosyltransferase
MRVTIVLLIKNGVTYLPEILQAIREQQTAFEINVVGIDSGSTDGSLEVLKRHDVDIIEIAPSAFNHGDTRNLGAQRAGDGTDYVVYLTQDATPANPLWLANLLAPFLDDDRVAGVFSRHLPRPISSPSMVRQLTQRWQTGQADRLVKEMPEDRALYQRNRLFYIYFSNTSSAIRREVWRQIPFPTTDFAEDAAWADSVLCAGYRTVFEPNSLVIHSHDYPLFEQFRQNVDHMAGMCRLSPDAARMSSETWLRLFAGIPRETLADWHFIWSSSHFAPARLGRKLGWMVHSGMWQTASVVGTWVGAHSDRLPSFLRSKLSHQERVRRS